MRTRACALAAVILATGPIAGCGDDDDDDKPLSKAEYIEQADAICKESSDRVDAEAEKAFADLGENARPTVEQITSFAEDTLVPELRKQISEIRDLPAPEGDEDELNEIYDDVEDATSKIEDDPSILLEDGEDPLAEPSAAAEAYGFKECGEG